MLAAVDGQQRGIMGTPDVAASNNHGVLFRTVELIQSHVIACILIVCTASLVFADTLRGTVKNADGMPIVGARVDISTAAPKTGPSLYCPSCYVDCAKYTKTDEQGQFVFDSLDPTLRFRLLATAPSWQTARTDLVDPVGECATITLSKFPADTPSNRILQGTVSSTDGVPVSGALVYPTGAKTATRRWGGRVTGANAAVSDDEGMFRMLLTEDFIGVDVEVTAHGYPGAVEEFLAPGGSLHRIKVPTGASVTGRLLYRGQPLSDVQVMVSQVNRARHDRPFIKCVPATTDLDGVFRFTALPANEPYVIYSSVGAGMNGPVLTTQMFDVGNDGGTRNLGTMRVAPGLTLAGNIRMTDNTDIPDDIHLFLNRYPWNSTEIVVEPDGTFCIENLPLETYEVALRGNKSLLLDAGQSRFQVLGTQSFGIRLTQTVRDVEVPLLRWKKGDPPIHRQFGPDIDLSGDQTLSGIVLDRDGSPTPDVSILVGVARGGWLRRKNSQYEVTSDEQGRFTIPGLPDEDIELMFRNRKAFGYPLGITSSGKPGKLTLYPGYVRPRRNQTDIRLLFDPELTTPPVSLH